MNNYNDRYNDYDGEEYTPSLRRRRRNSVQKGQSKRRKSKKRKKTPLQKFLTIIFSVFAVYLAALGIFTLAAYLSDDPNDKPLDILTSVIGGKVPERTNFVIMCTDEDGTRTDTIMVGCYNSVTNGLDIISIPRDTLVSVSAAHFEQMQAEYPSPDSQEMQINHIHHFIGVEDGPEVLVDELESLLDIKLDYYVRVNFDAFRYFVDSIGGVDFDVPRDMNYDDPTQDLAIHLEKGIQHLDGDKAEQLVRYRKENNGIGYANGDIGRIEVQQAFLKALVKKAVSGSTIKSNPKAYITTFFKYVTTNASIGDIVKYSSELDKIDTDAMNTYLLPGEAHNRYYYDREEVDRLVYEIFKRPSSEILAELTAEENGTAPTDSKSASIQVLNGGYTNGRAGEVQDLLNNEGYNVADIDTYDDTKKEETRIYVSKDGLGEDLIPYFNNAVVIKDTKLTVDYDIVVVIGTDE